MGFYGVARCGRIDIDNHLITALVGRPETHAFHLPVGEATLTLQDVAIIWGLPVEGLQVITRDSDRTKDEWVLYSQEWLGFVPTVDMFRGASCLKLIALGSHFEQIVITEYTPQLEIRAWARITMIVSRATRSRVPIGRLYVDEADVDELLIPPYGASWMGTQEHATWVQYWAMAHQSIDGGDAIGHGRSTSVDHLRRDFIEEMTSVRRLLGMPPLESFPQTVDPSQEHDHARSTWTTIIVPQTPHTYAVGPSGYTAGQSGYAAGPSASHHTPYMPQPVDYDQFITPSSHHFTDLLNKDVGMAGPSTYARLSFQHSPVPFSSGFQGSYIDMDPSPSTFDQQDIDNAEHGLRRSMRERHPSGCGTGGHRY
ncbi:hypothetical protein DH2020_038111 [Rehmannia glutinosa]|uniref:Aminotransferase-like plant mobile domain-containing protein n=1 Tax=Rehmannia glutinosa TaxID=99300 RepID=A0ABR0V185_REHGL